MSDHATGRGRGATRRCYDPAMSWQFLPPALDLEAASFSFNLPARTVLRRQSVASVSTSDKAAATTLRLTLGPTLIRLVFEPHLVLDLPPPLGDMGLQSIERDLRTGAITPNLWNLPGLGLHVGRDQALEQARAWMRDLLTTTPMAIAPYDPTADRELAIAVQQVLANLQADSPALARLARDVSLSAKLVVREPLAADAGPGGFRVPAGATISLRADLAGSPAEVQSAPRIVQVVVECSSAVLRKDGADQAEVGRFILRPGGALTVEQVRPLGEAGQVAGLESLVRLIGALSSHGSGALDPAHLEPAAVEALAKQEIEAALRPALLEIVAQNAGATPGIDLEAVLGIA